MSTFAEWDPALETGDPTVDEQHRQLYELVNEMNDTVASGRSDELIAASFGRIIEYARSHFAYEEALMERIGYPGIETQMWQHREFAKEVELLWSEILSGDRVSPGGLVDFMKEWLSYHVDQEDRKIGAFIRSHQG